MAARLQMRSGFSLVETLTALAITGIVAAVIVARTVAPRGAGESVAAIQTIFGISEAAAGYRGMVGRYPSKVVDLVSRPTTAVDLCGRSVPQHFLDEWRGPYLTQRVGAEGIALGDATLENQLGYEAPNGVSGLGNLVIAVTNMEIDVAERVDRAIDDDDDLAAGSIRFAPTSSDSDTGTLTYAIPIRGC